MNDNRPIWEQLDYAHDAIIQASAGTGKTYALEHIVAYLVKEKKVDIRKLLLVTFTEKAAGELKERIRKILADTDAAKHIDQATICTIHSFCQELLQEYPFESRMQMGMEVANSDKSVIDKAVRNVISSQRYAEQEGAAFAQGSSKDAEGAVSAVAAKIAGAVQSGLSHDAWREASIVRRFEGYRDVLRELCAEIRRQNGGQAIGQYILGKISFTSRQKTNKEKFENLDSLLSDLDAVESTLKSVQEKGIKCLSDLSGLGVAFGLFDSEGNKIMDASGKDLKFDKAFPLYKKLKETAAEGAKIAETTTLDSLAKLGYAEYRRLKKRSRTITFDDMVLETSRVVRDAVEDSNNPAKQAFLKAIRSRYRIALVDEFQDTDDKQWTIFRSLFSSQVNRVEGAQPVQGSLIVVGDPKQAIYGFRGADIGTYLKACKEIENDGGTVLSLDTMYRSTEEMVKAFNAIFSAVGGDAPSWFMGMQANGLPIEYDAVKFPTENIPEGVKGFQYPGHERAIELLESMPDDDGGVARESCRSLFLENMAAEMKRLHSDAFWMGRTDPKDRMNWSSMCVLAKSHADCEAAQEVLREKGIPCRRYKEAGLFSSVESETVLALFDYLTMPRSSGNLAALLLTPLCDVPLSGIEEKLESGGGEIGGLCDKWRAMIAKREWTRFFESVMRDTALGRAHLGDEDHLRHCSGIRQIFDQLLERCGRAKDLSEMTDTLRHWCRDDSDAGDEGSVRNKESESDAVQIMTMHAAKGLEFNAVFVPYGFSAMAKRNMPKDEKSAGVMEVKRLLYVALTRAKYKLYLPWSKRMANDSFTKETALGSVLGDGIRKLFASLYGKDPSACVRGVDAVPPRTEGARADGAGMAKADATADSCPDLPPTRGMKGWRFKWDSFSSMNHHGASQKDPEVEGAKRQEDELPGEIEKPESLVSKGVLSGTVFHEVMEVLCNHDAAKGEVDFSIGKTDDFKSLVDEREGKASMLLEVVRRRMGANGVVNRTGRTDGESTAVSIARMAWNALRTELDFGGDTFRLCEIEKKDRKAEVNFVLDEKEIVGNASRRDGALNGSIDLIVRRPDGRYCIVDWKTNALDSYDDASVKTAMDEAGYHLQYKIYSYAAEKWLGGPVVQGVAYLFVRGGEFSEGASSGVYRYASWQADRAGFAQKLAARFAECDQAEEAKDEEGK